MFRTLLIVAVSATVLFAAVPPLINYQGRLTDGSGDPVTDGIYQITFTLYDALSGGNSLWTSGQQPVDVADGLFSCGLGSSTPLPDSIFLKYSEVYLGIKVGSDAEISPRTQLLSVGYAFRALQAETAADNYWTLSDSVIYTRHHLGIARGGADNMLWGNNAHQHVNLGSICTTGTSSSNDYYLTVAGGVGNVAAGDLATVGGGGSNRAIEPAATIGGGSGNTAGSAVATVSGGASNTASGYASTVGGGEENVAAAGRSTIAGGYANTISASGDYSYLFGIESSLSEDSTFMVDMPHIRFGDETDGYEFPPARGSDNQLLVSDGSGILSWIDLPEASKWTVTDSVVYTNSRWGLAKGSANNKLWGTNVYGHINLGIVCTTGVSTGNVDYATVAGGFTNAATAGSAVVGGGRYNRAISYATTVAGGASNVASGTSSAVGGGTGNLCGGNASAIAGGELNTTVGSNAAIGGGYDNTANANFSTVAGGELNMAYFQHASVGGGYSNLAGYVSTVAGGYADTASGQYATIPGGYLNKASGNYTLAAGQRAKAIHDGAFVWGDNTAADFASTGTNQFLIRASGGVGVGTDNPDVQLDVNGDLALRAGSYTVLSSMSNNITVGQRSFIRLVGAGGAFTITGIAGGYDGKLLILFNTSGFAMTIANENANSLAANRIMTLTGFDEVTVGTGSVTMIYDVTAQRWIITAVKP